MKSLAIAAGLAAAFGFGLVAGVSHNDSWYQGRIDDLEGKLDEASTSGPFWQSRYTAVVWRMGQQDGWTHGQAELWAGTAHDRYRKAVSLGLVD